MFLCWRFGWLGSSRSQPSEGPGAGQDPAASLSLGRLLPQAGRAGCSRHLNAWRAAACFGLRHVVAETSGGSKRPRVCFSMPGDGAMGNLAEMSITILAGERWTLKHRLLPTEYLTIWKREDDLRLSLVRNLTT
ncbi:hypothetical protein R6Z07M_007960 [Ovis aries]